MSEWAPDGFARKHARAVGLSAAIQRLSPKARQAFHAAATRQELKRGSWDGCAFNVAGDLTGVNIRTYEMAAKTFEMPVEDVKTFIRAWDHSGFRTDEKATAYLKYYLEEAGLFDKPGNKEFAGKTFVKIVFESDQTRERRVFDAMVEGLGVSNDLLDSEMQEFKDATVEASVLLTA